ncbi:hypothetical protein Tco_0313594 [Tanacetum coccineum]
MVPVHHIPIWRSGGETILDRWASILASEIYVTKAFQFRMDEFMVVGHHPNTMDIIGRAGGRSSLSNNCRASSQTLHNYYRTKGNEELIEYLAAAKEAISAVLMRTGNAISCNSYFVSRALFEGQRFNFIPMESWGKDINQWTTYYGFFMERAGGRIPRMKPMDRTEEITGTLDLFTDGSYCIDGSGAGLILTQPRKGFEFTYAMREFSIKQVPRSKNKKTNALSKIASTSFAHLSKQVLMEELKEKSINEKEILTVVEEEGNTWMKPICEYLTKEILSADKKKARAIRRKAAMYTMINGTLFKKFFLRAMAQVCRDRSKQLRLREIHKGSEALHSGS